MNLADIAVIIIIAFFALAAYRKGFVKAVLGILPMGISLFATYYVYPAVSKLLIASPLYSSLKDKIAQSFQLSDFISTETLAVQTELINNMQLPEFLKKSLIENNNPVVYDILHVEDLQNYITGFIANIAMNILAMLLVFIAAFIVTKVLLTALNLVTKLPVIHSFNKVCGLAVGMIQGVMVVWLLGIGITFFYYNDWIQPIAQMLQRSVIAEFFYENNLLLFMILKIFA